jgi:hypothetical protein
LLSLAVVLMMPISIFIDAAMMDIDTNTMHQQQQQQQQQIGQHQREQLLV